MTNGQTNLIRNYNSLKKQLESVGKRIHLSKALSFCTLFGCDNLDLYDEFMSAVWNCVHPNDIETEDIIKLYAKFNGLDPEKDKALIADLFVKNAIENAVSYHLTHKNNVTSIMQHGLGNNPHEDFKTEERKDFEYLVKLFKANGIDEHLITPCMDGDYTEDKVFYADKPLASFSYGKKPEWLDMLSYNVEFLKENPAVWKKVQEVLDKYKDKYANADRTLIIIPHQNGYSDYDNYMASIKDYINSEDWFSSFLKRDKEDKLIDTTKSVFYEKINSSTTNNIAPTNIIVANLQDANLYVLGESGKLINTADSDLLIHNTSRR